jgi:hypothetical protein
VVGDVVAVAVVVVLGAEALVFEPPPHPAVEHATARATAKNETARGIRVGA